MVLRRLVLENMMTIDVVLHLLWKGTGTRLHRKIIGDAILPHLILVIVVMAVLRPHLLRHPMIAMIDEATAMGIILRLLHLQGDVLLRLVVGTTMIGRLRGKLLAARTNTGS